MPISNNTPAKAGKVLTIVVPAYNSEEFLENCLDSLVGAGSALEVLVVNDGSKDSTLQIAQGYESRYPDVVKVVDQENRGWGGAISHGIELASGEFFFVVDSDDRLDTEVLKGVLSVLQHTMDTGAPLDLLVTNYVYDHIEDGSSHTICYRNIFPSGRLFGWNEVVNKPKIDEYLMIHAMTYRTELVRQYIGELPQHVSYMDSLLCLRPLAHTSTILYLDVDLYYYRIGREGQTIDVNVIQKHMDEQYLAVRLAIESVDYADLASKGRGLAVCVSRYLSAMLTVSCIYTYKLKDPDELTKLEELWDYLKGKDPQMYDALKFTFARMVHRHTAPGRSTSLGGYTLASKIFKFA